MVLSVVAISCWSIWRRSCVSLLSGVCDGGLIVSFNCKGSVVDDAAGCAPVRSVTVFASPLTVVCDLRGEIGAGVSFDGSAFSAFSSMFRTPVDAVDSIELARSTVFPAVPSSSFCLCCTAVDSRTPADCTAFIRRFDTASSSIPVPAVPARSTAGTPFNTAPAFSACLLIYSVAPSLSFDVRFPTVRLGDPPPGALSSTSTFPRPTLAPTRATAAAPAHRPPPS